jgi:hypothetical protein
VSSGFIFSPSKRKRNPLSLTPSFSRHALKTLAKGVLSLTRKEMTDGARLPFM